MLYTNSKVKRYLNYASGGAELICFLFSCLIVSAEIC